MVFLGLFESIAGDVQFDDHRVMDQTIDRGSGRHRILENLLPFGKGEIRTDKDTAPFVALRKEREQDFHLLATLLDVAQVVDDQGLELLKLLDHSLQTQIPFGS